MSVSNYEDELTKNFIFFFFYSVSIILLAVIMSKFTFTGSKGLSYKILKHMQSDFNSKIEHILIIAQPLKSQEY